MDRFYRALWGLSIAALVLGLLTTGLSFLYGWWESQFAAVDLNPSILSFPGLLGLGMQPVILGAGLLSNGVCLMSMTLAWLDSRKRSFVLLALVTLGVYLPRQLLDVWYSFAPNQGASGWYVQLTGGTFSMSGIYLSTLIPVVAALIFVRSARGRARVDAELGLLRSAL